LQNNFFPFNMALIKKWAIGMVLFILLISLVSAIKTFQYEETDLVKIKTKATDPDNDQVTYSYSHPLDQNGEWQTGYDDAGEYQVNVTVSDGVNSNTEKILIEIANRNRLPQVLKNELSVKEGELIDLTSVVIDPDGDNLQFSFSEPFNNQGRWQTSFSDAGLLETNFTMTDGGDNINVKIAIQIDNVNQPPKIINSFSKSVDWRENEEVKFFVEAEDEEELSYRWFMDGRIIWEKAEGEFIFDYDSAGKHQLRVAITDGLLTTSKEWEVDVINTNRKPKIDHPSVTVNENEKIILTLPKTDADGDVLRYSFSAPLDEKGAWIPSYDDAGKHRLKFTASDGEFTSKESVEVEVVDVDRAPVLNLAPKLYAEEGLLSEWILDTADPDGDQLEITITDIPESAQVNAKTKTLSWTPPYETIVRSGGLFSNVLNKMRLEHFMLRQKTFPITVTVCAKELCTSDKTFLSVRNVNRPPQFVDLRDVTITATELAMLPVSATDPDGDIIHFYFTGPLGKSTGKWQTNYEDKGNHTVWVTATDGKRGITQAVNLHVLKNNRPPTLKVKDAIQVKEGQEFSFQVAATDPDEDVVAVKLENLPIGASFADGVFTWQPSFDTVNHSGEEKVWLNLVGDDGDVETIHPVEITIKNVNQAPDILDYLPQSNIQARVGVPVVFHAAATDEEELAYEWSFGWSQEKVEGTDTVERTFLSPGSKKVKVVVSDGSLKTEKEWMVNVEEVVVKEVKKPSTIPREPFGIKVQTFDSSKANQPVQPFNVIVKEFDATKAITDN
jgi:hypothetical protein